MQKLNFFNFYPEIMVNNGLCEQNIQKGLVFGGDGSIQTALKDSILIQTKYGQQMADERCIVVATCKAQQKVNESSIVICDSDSVQKVGNSNITISGYKCKLTALNGGCHIVGSESKVKVGKNAVVVCRFSTKVRAGEGSVIIFKDIHTDFLDSNKIIETKLIAEIGEDTKYKPNHTYTVRDNVIVEVE